MAMAIGSVAIDPQGNVSGTGAVRELYDLLEAQLGGDIPGGEEGKPAKDSFATIATVFATWMVTHVQANAELTVSTSGGDAGMQNSTSVGVDTGAPLVAFQGGGVI